MPLRGVLLLAYLVLAAGGLTGGFFRGSLTSDGLLLGLPAGLFWTVAWALATFLALGLYDAAGRRAETRHGRVGHARAGHGDETS